MPAAGSSYSRIQHGHHYIVSSRPKNFRDNLMPARFCVLRDQMERRLLGAGERPNDRWWTSCPVTGTYTQESWDRAQAETRTDWSTGPRQPAAIGASRSARLVTGRRPGTSGSR